MMKPRTVYLILIIFGASIMLLPLAFLLGESPKNMLIIVSVAIGGDIIATIVITLGMKRLTH